MASSGRGGHSSGAALPLSGEAFPHPFSRHSRMADGEGLGSLGLSGSGVLV